MSTTIHGVEFVPYDRAPFTVPCEVERTALEICPNGGWVFFDGRFGAYAHSEPSADNMNHVWPNHTWINRFWVLVGPDGRVWVPQPAVAAPPEPGSYYR